MPVVEVMINGPEVERHIASGAPLQELERAAREAGMRPMYEVALEAVQEGRTTSDEVERVLGSAARTGIVEPESETQATTAPEPPPPGPETHGPHTLLVDDDPVNRTLARTLLERAGQTVVEAKDGIEALDHLVRAADTELIVLDLDMPRLDGIETLKRIRGSVSTAMLPVIVLTGMQDEETEVRLMEMGADDYIRKPIDAPRFVARVKAALRRVHAA
jgi:CheY-like chemotaxis protein